MDDLKKLKLPQLVQFLRMHGISERGLSKLKEEEIDGLTLVSINADGTLRAVGLTIGTVTNVKNILERIEKVVLCKLCTHITLCVWLHAWNIIWAADPSSFKPKMFYI